MNDAAHSSLAGREVRLGRSKPGEAKLKMKTYLKESELPTLPMHSRNAVHITRFPMLGNDRYGDCTCAALGHAREIWNWRDTLGKIAEETEQDALDVYWATGNQDDGRMIVDVLSYVKKSGYAGKSTIDAYVQIDHKDATERKASVYLFGGMDIGIWLPTAAQEMIDVWDIPEGQALTGDWEPGSWGGHSIFVQGYNYYSSAKYNYVGVTWGERVKITHRFFDAYVDEAYAAISPLWLTSLGQSPQGFDRQALDSDLAQL